MMHNGRIDQITPVRGDSVEDPDARVEHNRLAHQNNISYQKAAGDVTCCREGDEYLK